MNLRWTLGAMGVSILSSAACSGQMEGARPPTPPEPAYDAVGAGDSCVQIDIYPQTPSEATDRPPLATIEAAPRAARTCAPGHLQDCTEQCRRGDAGSCVLLGVMVLRGQGTPANEARAADLFERACKADNMAGCNNLGVAFSEGQGRPRNDARAVELFRQACAGGTPHGCVNEGELYDAGRGVRQDYHVAAARYEQACNGGVMVGCATLGLLYESGRVGVTDGALAMRLYQKACVDRDYLVEQCNGGDPDGCTAYGICLVHGLGQPVDKARGKSNIQRGCAWGLAAACDVASRVDRR
jgi:TPR repeat protein